MDFYSLQCFRVLAELLSFRRAAERVNITQPALSLRLKRLEDELGFQLFDRSRAHVALSDAGREFLPHALQLLNQAETVRETARSIATGRAGQLRIGYTPVSFFGAVPDIIRAFAASHPSADISLTELLSEEVENALCRMEIDVGFLHPPVRANGLKTSDLNPEPYIVALPETNPLCRRTSVRLKDLANEDFILVRRDVGPVLYDKIIRLCGDNGFTPAIRQEVTTSIAVLGLVAAGHGVGFVVSSMSYVRRPGLCFRPIAGPTPILPLAVAMRAGGGSVLLERFEAFAIDFAAEGGRGSRSA